MEGKEGIKDEEVRKWMREADPTTGREVEKWGQPFFQTLGHFLGSFCLEIEDERIKRIEENELTTPMPEDKITDNFTD